MDVGYLGLSSIRGSGCFDPWALGHSLLVNFFKMAALPIMAFVQKAASGRDLHEVRKAVVKLTGYVLVGWAIFGTPINDFVPTDGWDWGFVDCFYFTMAVRAGVARTCLRVAGQPLPAGAA